MKNRRLGVGTRRQRGISGKKLACNLLAVAFILSILLITFVPSAQAAPSYFFKEHMKLKAYQRASSGYTEVSKTYSYPTVGINVLVQKEISSPVEVTGAVLDSGNGVWFVTTDNRYVPSGYRWNGSKFVDESVAKTFLRLPANANYDFTIPGLTSTIKLESTSISKGSTAAISGKVTSDSAIQSLAIIISSSSGETVWKNDVYTSARKSDGSWSSTSNFNRTSADLNTISTMGSTLAFGVQTTLLNYGTYTIKAEIGYGVLKPSTITKTVGTLKVTDPTVYPTSITATKLSVKKGSTGQLKATVKPSGAEYSSVTWKEVSDPDDCITLTSAGKVTAKKEGSAKVRATVTWKDKASGSTKTKISDTTVTVYSPDILVTGIKLSETQINFAKAESRQLTAEVTPASATNKELAWTSSNTSVATVSDTGLVTAVGNGTATITAAAKDGSGISATCAVTVDVLSLNPTTPLTQGESVQINKNDGARTYFSFTPSSTGLYAFHSSGNILSGTVALYDSNWNYLSRSRERLMGGASYSLIYSLTAGKTYYIAAWTSHAYFYLKVDALSSEESFLSRASFKGVDTIKRGEYYTITVKYPEAIPSSIDPNNIGSFRFMFISASSNHVSGDSDYDDSTTGNLFEWSNWSKTVIRSKLDETTYQYSLEPASLITEPGKYRLLLQSITDNGIILCHESIEFTVLDTQLPTMPNVVFDGNSFDWYNVSGYIDTEDEIEEILVRAECLEDMYGTKEGYLVEDDGIKRVGNHFLLDLGFVGGVIEGRWSLGFKIKVNGVWSQITENTTYNISTYGATGLDTIFKYALSSNGDATIIGYIGEGGNVIIPATIDGHPVTKIAAGAFQHERSPMYKNDITSVVIPEGVTSIGDKAFSQCWNLESVTIPASVTSIGQSVFHNCDALSSMNIASGNTSFVMDGKALYSADKKRLLIVISDRQSSTNITLPSTLETIDENAMDLSQVELSSDSLPSSLKRIGKRALRNAHTPSGKMVIPASVTQIEFGDNTFGYSINYIDVEEGNSYYSSMDGVLFDKSGTTLLYYPEERSDISYVIPEGVTSIGAYAFYWRVRDFYLSMPDSLLDIGDYNFYYGQGLKSVRFSPYLRSIGKNCFRQLTLTEIYLPETLASIGSGSFLYSDSLKICGAAGSLAEQYALANEIPFQSQIPIAIIEKRAYLSKKPGVTFKIEPVIVPEYATPAEWWVEEKDDDVMKVTSDGAVTTKGVGISSMIVHSAEDPTITGEVVVGVRNSLDVSIAGRADANGYVHLDITGAEGSHGNYPISAISLIFSAGETQFEPVNAVCIPANSDEEIELALFIDEYDSDGSCWLFAETRDESTMQLDGITFRVTLRAKNIEEKWGQSVSYPIPQYGVDLISDGFGTTADNYPSEIVIEYPQKYSGTCGENATWQYIDGVLTISGTGAMADYEWGATPWQEYGDKIYSIVVEEGITKIGDTAFFTLQHLERVELPDGLLAIGEYAINANPALTECVIPESVTTIGKGVLAGSNLQNIAIPENVKFIGANAFTESKNLYHINVAEENEYYISMGGILYDKQMKTLICRPAGMQEDVFTVPDGVEAIETFALGACESLTEVILPDGLLSIKNHAFYHDVNLTKVTIPASVEEIGNEIFRECTKVTIKCFENSKAHQYAVANNIPFELMTIKHSGDYWTLDSEGTLTIGGGKVSSFAEHPWTEFKDEIINVIYEEGVNIVVDESFKDCVNLKSVTFSSTMTGIYNSAFKGCAGLETFVIPETITVIGSSAFEGCTGLKEIIIPDTVTSIGTWAFCDCTSLEKVYISGNAVLNANYHFHTCPSLKLVVYGAGATEVKEYSYLNTTNVTDVFIPASVTTIGENTFKSCAHVNIYTTVGSRAAEWASGKSNMTVIYMDERDYPTNIPDPLPINIGLAEAKLAQNTFVYTGKTKTPVFSVKLDGEEMIDAAYDATWSNNINPGTATLTIIGRGEYAGMITLTATIFPAGEKLCAVPAAMTTLEEEAFAGTAFREIQLSEKTVNVGANCFKDSGAVQITLSNAAANVSTDAFTGLNGITIIAPETLRIGEMPVSDFCELHGFYYEAMK